MNTASVCTLADTVVVAEPLKQISSQRNAVSEVSLWETLPETPELSSTLLNVVSFNTLSNWWYVFKYYHPSVPMESRLWQSSRQKLMQRYLLSLNFDVLCLQEIRPDTFAEDFAFLNEPPFECRLEKSNNQYMRCAIAWRTDKCTLVHEHKRTQRALLLTLEQSQTLPSTCGFQFVVASCHLSAGDAPDQRIRQLEGVLKVVEKKYGATAVVPHNNRKKKAKVAKCVDHVPLIICGDFNSEPIQAARHYLLNRSIDASFVDPISPQICVSRKPKSHNFHLCDAYERAVSNNSEMHKRPDTMIVKEIFALCYRQDAHNKLKTTKMTNKDNAIYEYEDEIEEADQEFKICSSYRNRYSISFLNAILYMFKIFAVKQDVGDTLVGNYSRKFSQDESNLIDSPSLCTRGERKQHFIMPVKQVAMWLDKLHGPAKNRDQSGVHHERLAIQKLEIRAEQAQLSSIFPESTVIDQVQQQQKEKQLVAPVDILDLAPGFLTFQDFTDIYVEELERNPWSVMYDMIVLGATEACFDPKALMPPSQGGLPFFSRVYDYIYFSFSHFDLQGVRQPLSSNAITEMHRTGVCLPNVEIPSDHLSVGCQLKCRSRSRQSVLLSPALSVHCTGTNSNLLGGLDLECLTAAISEHNTYMAEPVLAELRSWMLSPVTAASTSGNKADTPLNLEWHRRQVASDHPDLKGKKMYSLIFRAISAEFVSVRQKKLTKSETKLMQTQGRALTKAIIMAMPSPKEEEIGK